MHRMLPINRMYCSAEASQADTPDRATEGGPAKRPKRAGEHRGEQRDQEEGCRSAGLSEEMKWEMRKEREMREVCQHTMREKKNIKIKSLKETNEDTLCVEL